MKVESKIKLRSITWPQWWLLAFVILVVLPVVIAFAFFPAIYGWYLQVFVEPELEKELGFRAGEVAVRSGDQTYETYAVISVRRGGAFERAGVKPGDIPYGYSHGIRSGFLDHLYSSRGDEAKLRFVNKADADKGNWEPRRILVAIPGKTPAN